MRREAGSIERYSGEWVIHRRGTVKNRDSKRKLSVCDRGTLRIAKEERITIDEIKGIYMDLSYLEEPVGVHLALSGLPTYMYAQQILHRMLKWVCR